MAKTSTKPNPLEHTILRDLLTEGPSRSELTRIKILNAAIKTYSKVGGDYFSYEDVAREGKLTRSLVNYYYPDSNELFMTAVKFARARFQDLAVKEMAKTHSIEEAISVYSTITFTWLEQYPHDARFWMLFWALVPSNPKLKSLHAELTEMGALRIIELLKNAHKLSGKTKSKELMVRAKAIQRVMTGALTESLTENRSLSSLREETLNQCLILFHQKF